VRRKPNVKKKEYMILVRKIRKYLSELKKQGKISKEDYNTARKKTRNKEFKNLTQAREYIGGLRK
jgi:ribosomal protein L19E